MPEVRLIDANALKKAIADAFYNLHEIAYIADIIERQPTIEAEPVRHAEWEYRHADDWMFCTACGADAEGDCGAPLETLYCPSCGARMDGGAENG